MAEVDLEYVLIDHVRYYRAISDEGAELLHRFAGSFVHPGWYGFAGDHPIFDGLLSERRLETFP